MRAGVVGAVGRVKAWVSPEQVPGLTSAKVQAVAESGRSGECGESTVKATRDVVDDFVEHYHAMNPGQTAK